MSDELPRVLLVDDRPENLLALEAVLQPLPCRLTSVTSGDDALKAILNDTFAVVLLDVQMPGLDGFETAELIKGRERTRTLPIIFVTAISKERHNVFRGYSAGAVDYVFKPYDPGILRSKVSVFLELDAASRAAKRNESLMRAAFDHAPTGMARLDLDYRIAEVNRALADLLGRRRNDLRDRRLDDLVHPDDLHRDEDRRQALADGAIGVFERELRLTAQDGTHIPCQVSFALAHAGEDAPDMIVAQVQDLRERQRAEAERARLIHERSAREQAEQVSERLKVVQTITDLALSSLAFDDLLRELLHRTAEALTADAAAIVLQQPEDPEATVYRVAGGVDAPLHEPADADATGADHPLGSSVKSVLGVPLVVEGRAIGMLHVGTLFPRRFSDDDTALLGLAADRAALAIERVRLFEREHRIASELQRSLLPSALPELPGVSAAARYQPAGAGSQVGGDWYDVLLQPDGRLLLVMGDVAGRGIEAASTMGQLRSALRAYAFDGHSPGELLERLNAFQSGLAKGGMATLALVSVDPEAEEIRYSTAGHPPALLLAPDAEPIWLEDVRGVPLGAIDDVTFRESVVPLPPGSTLILYTDGLVETRTEHLDRGLERLLRAARGGPRDLDALCEHVLADTLLDPEVDDDVTLLIIRTVSASDPRVEMKIPGNPGGLQAFRATARRWVAKASADPAEIDEVILAVNEAVQNAIEHGHSGHSAPVGVVLERSGLDLDIVVSDRGTWGDRTTTDRGRGLELMRSLMDDVSVEANADGTSVHLRRRIRQPTPAASDAATVSS